MSTAVFIALLFVGVRAAEGQRNLAGSERVRVSMEKLLVTGSALMIAAHPDDENTAVIAYFARGRKIRTAYLALNRGEGGQNLLGPEQGALVGIIRTQELLQAREIDGGEQFFTRVVDFGYSKTAEETLQKWGREKTLRDVVWVIRKFQPDIIINRFSGTSRDGHGHHQSSAMLGKEAFEAAGDPNRFPELLPWVKPWQAKRIYWNTFSWRRVEEQLEEKEARITLPTGEYDPLLGYSYQEIAGASRSQHRSQTMGAPERKGEAKDYLVPIDGLPANADPFAGIDITWGRVPGAGKVEALLTKALTEFDFNDPAKSVPSLLDARQEMLKLERSALVERKLGELEETIALCAGLWMDASATSYEVVPGSELTVNLEAVNRSSVPLVLQSAVIAGENGEVAFLDKPVPLPYNKREWKPLKFQVAAGYPISNPYWLEEEPKSDRYQVSDDNLLLIGRPETPPAYQARFVVKYGDGEHAQEIAYERPVHHRYVDPMYGELTRPLVVTPPLTLALAQRSLVFPTAEAKQVDVTLTAHQSRISGTAALKVPEGWKVSPASVPFAIQGSNETVTAHFTVTPPPGDDIAELAATATVGEKLYERSMKVVDYPHFPPQTLFPRETARLVRESVELLSRRVGYVMGAGDEIPPALEQVGAKVTLLSETDLARGDLSQYDAIVTGVRAYNTRPDLVANHKRLLDYAEKGGTLITQYNTTRNFGAGVADPVETLQLGPYPFQIGRDRVSVEDAPVTMLKPEHPLLSKPNRIRADDFEGWIQERGLYFPSKFDERYDTVISSHDPGEESLTGGILYAPYGKGVFIFTSYSWFRQLPAGVPGAFRLFANMLSAGKARE